MHFFMRKSTEKSITDFDESLDKYFEEARKYRSSLRKGSIILLDKHEKLFKFFSFLVEKCGLDVGVIKVSSPEEVWRTANDLGLQDVKAVVIDSDVFEEELVNRLKKNSRIPVWVVNCGDDVKKRKCCLTSKVGIIEKEAPLIEVAEMVGFPKECEKFAAEFAV